MFNLYYPSHNLSNPRYTTCLTPLHNTVDAVDEHRTQLLQQQPHEDDDEDDGQHQQQHHHQHPHEIGDADADADADADDEGRRGGD